MVVLVMAASSNVKWGRQEVYEIEGHGCMAVIM